MPFGSVRLIPGVNVERTPTLNEAGISESNLIRFKDSLAQKYGGWSLFFGGTLGGVPRDLHAWQDLNENKRLGIGTTAGYGVINNGAFQSITPQTLVSDFAPDFSTTAGSRTIEVTDPNISNPTVQMSVFFNTPVAVGGIILSGYYPIKVVTGVHSYQIEAASPAAATVANGGVVPAFSTAASSSIVTVTLPTHGLSVGGTIAFSIPTTGDGVTISGGYQATSIPNANQFTIQASQQGIAGATFDMNGGAAELVYYIAIGPLPAGVGFGIGPYGAGGFGSGVVPSGQTGAPIAAIDWTSENWGQIIIACPAGGIPYYWDPTGGFYTMSPVSGAPAFNSGMFVSSTAQILVLYGSSVAQTIGVLQDPLLVSWSDSGNFFDFDARSDNLAGNFRIPLGSEIRGGMAVTNQNLIWTDLDCWAMNFIGYPDTYGFNQIGAGAGMAGRHAAQKLRGIVGWMGLSNFYKFDGGGVSVIPCPVWDAVFQNFNLDFAQNVRAMPNTAFNEMGWLYPSLASANGECDSYVKMNITDPAAPWDYGRLPRSAWIDQSVFGLSPIAASPSGQVFQHEMTPDAAGASLNASFTTGYFMIAEGEEFAFVDQILPDFKWGTYAGAPTAQVLMTFNVIDYPGDTPRTYGPYALTQGMEYLSVRFRGRQMSITIASNDVGSFWRIGRIRYRYSAAGRR